MNISVVSGKGGAGKTFVALHLASLLQDKAILVDLDVEEPDAHLYIKGKEVDTKPAVVLIPEVDESKCTHCKECASVCQFHALVPIKNKILVLDHLCQSCTACWTLCPTGAITPVEKKVGSITTFRGNDITLIEGRLIEGEIAVVPIINQAKSFAYELGKDKKHIIFDSPPGTSCAMVNSVTDSDLVVVVAEDTLFGLHDMLLVLDTLTHLNLPFLMVVNKEQKGHSVIGSWAEEHKEPIVASLPFDRRISMVYGRGNTIFNDLPEYKEPFRTILQAIEKLDTKNI